MIKFFIIANKQGNPRIVRFYKKCENRIQLREDIVKSCIRQNKLEGFIEHDGNVAVYRVYASLVFIAGIDEDENELATLELTHNFIETLQQYFDKVSEIDILFNMDRVYIILDEMISNGDVAESNRNRILVPLNLMDASKK